jgi:hypothetical protein
MAGFNVITEALTLFVRATALTQSTAHTESEAPQWCAFARQYLETGNGLSFDCALEGRRCIRMNNYSCTKNFSPSAYEGQMVDAEGKPITDVDHHVLYEDPKWSIKKSIDVLRSYYIKQGKKSAIEIAETWAPWCDTNGSKLVHQGWGRTCKDGPGAVPATFNGPRCIRPTDGVPPKGQCGPCNCPNELAAFYAKDSGVGISVDLRIFDDQGIPTVALNKVLKRVVWMELGSRPSESLINNAIAVYKP